MVVETQVGSACRSVQVWGASGSARPNQECRQGRLTWGLAECGSGQRGTSALMSSMRPAERFGTRIGEGSTARTGPEILEMKLP